MSSFRTHISFGIAAGILGVIGLVVSAIADAPGLLIAIFALATLGSVLPDMDSDSSVPFHVAFGSLTLVTIVVAFASVYKETPSNWQALIGYTAGVGIFVWGVIGYLFKKLTHHRGMAHSIPAALLAGLICFFVASRLYFSDSDSFLLAVAITFGYVLHLVLDEVHAAINFHGKILVPNKAFGSALKIKSKNLKINLAVFGAIAFLFVGNTDRLWNLAVNFWNKIF